MLKERPTLLMVDDVATNIDILLEALGDDYYVRVAIAIKASKVVIVRFMACSFSSFIYRFPFVLEHNFGMKVIVLGGLIVELLDSLFPVQIECERVC